MGPRLTFRSVMLARSEPFIEFQVQDELYLTGVYSNGSMGWDLYSPLVRWGEPLNHPCPDASSALAQVSDLVGLGPLEAEVWAASALDPLQHILDLWHQAIVAPTHQASAWTSRIHNANRAVAQ